MKNLKSKYDVVIIGGGHNGLIAAAYLSRAGLSVLIVEKRKSIGGAAVSEQIFPAVDAQISKYSYLLSLFPNKIISDLGLVFESRLRKIASFTPGLRNNLDSALMVSNVSESLTEDSFLNFTGSSSEYKGYRKLLGLEQYLAQRIWPTLLELLLTRSELKQRFEGNIGRQVWDLFIEQPLGEGIEYYLKDDLVRGLVFTDAKIGILTHPYDPSLLQNRTFLYHVIGNELGQWHVPVGGMGRLTHEIIRVALRFGAEIVNDAHCERIEPGKLSSIVSYTKNNRHHSISAKFVLANVAPKVLTEMLPTYRHDAVEEGTAFKINMLLNRLPKLKTRSYNFLDAFTGTFHVDEGYERMKQTYSLAMNGIVAENPAGEMYCHTLTDDSILSESLCSSGYHTLTFFGLDMPYRLFRKDNEKVKEKVLNYYFKAINKYLAEPIESCIARDSEGNSCLEVKSAVDLEDEIALPYGNIFHNSLSWPFVENKEEKGTWGVETGFNNIFICGSGARRGGCVSGIPGHNAAMKVLQILKRI